MKIRNSLIKLSIFAVVTFAATVLLYFTIGNIRPGESYTSYKASFSDVTGLLPGDDVRVAGVQVGRVTSLKVVDGHARVSFQLQSDVRLTSAATAKIRYKNLLGQRYVSLVLSSEGRQMKGGDEIPIGQTQPALDLTTLFNGFKPLFKALSPEDVNKLASEVVATLQGEGGTVDALLASTSSLTNTLAARDAAIGRVITNLTGVVNTVAERDETLGQLIAELQRFTTGVAGDRDAIAGSLSSIDSLADATARLLFEARGSIDRDIADLNTVVGVVEKKDAVVDQAVKNLPGALNALMRAQSYGSWLNLYVCTLSVNTGSGPVPVTTTPDPSPGC